MAQATLRSVYFPLEKFEQCSVCGKAGNLRLCSACSEEVYCSQECQKRDWREHKVWCGGPGQTVKLELNSFYPFLATLAELAHQNTPETLRPQHPAFKQLVLNQPEASDPYPFPDGTSARVVLLGPHPHHTTLCTCGNVWWPSAPSEAARNRLRMRIAREGYLIPNLVAIATALLARVYTTTSVKAADSTTGKAQKRIRIHHRGSPIADFGISKGEVDIPPGSALAYHSQITGTTVRGQNPKDHYWLYFRTIKGEEYVLDCGVFTFGLEIVVWNDFYSQQEEEELFPSEMCPAAGLFVGKEMKKSPIRHKTMKQCSVLRDQSLADAIRHSERGFQPEDIRAISNFTTKVAQRELTAVESKLLTEWVLQDVRYFDRLLVRENWASWPKNPRVDFHNPAGNLFSNLARPGKGTDEGQDFQAFLAKWNRKYRKGALTYEEWLSGCQTWRVHDMEDLDDGLDDDEGDEPPRMYNISRNPIVQWVD